ncbi:MAG: tetratricopeptide repeat protein [Ignavibacteriae bacterium]|nr:MAG: tetratricopeptide repeat protein [Ignavibacteriota bacterium]
MNAAPVVTPSFAREALALLGRGQAEPALQLAAEGVKTYPSYLGGYIALADAYAALGHTDDATIILNEAERRFPTFSIVALRRQQLRSSTPFNNEVQQQRSTTPFNNEVQQQRSSTQLHNEVPQRSSPLAESPLRVINLAQPVADARVIRSASMRLIPGLEYTTLRFEGSKTRGSRSIQYLPEPPAFREFHKPGRPAFGLPPTQPLRRVSLEELADKIGRVRLTAEELEKRPPAPDPLQEERHSVVTETLARIYMSQKSYDKAIDAFTRLQDVYPDQREKFAALIDECTKLRLAEG